MATDKQIAANRRNALKSTGPKTAEGKAASRFNAVQHGFTADHFVTGHEEEPEFDKFRDEFIAEHQPTTPTEMFLVEQMVTSAWRLRRLRIAEAAYWDFKMAKLHDDVEDEFDDPRPRDEFAYAVDRTMRYNSTIANLSRYEARIERSFYKALHELEKLRRARGTDAICPEVKRSETKWTDPSVPLAPSASKPPTPIRQIGFVSQPAQPTPQNPTLHHRTDAPLPRLLP